MSLVAILSSSLIGVVVGALITGAFSLRAKRAEYVNAYYSLVLERRVKAYEAVERLVTMLKMAVVDADERPYHFAFSGHDELELYGQFLEITSQALWLSDDLFAKTRDLNLLVYERGDVKLLEFAKQNYEKIAELRTEIEALHGRDMLVLHDVSHFLKSKRHVDTYSPLPRRSQP